MHLNTKQTRELETSSFEEIDFDSGLSSVNSIRINIPSNLDLYELLKDHPVKKEPSFKIEKLYYFLSYLRAGFVRLDNETFVHPQLKDQNKQFFTPVHSDFLKNIFGHKYRDYLSFLVDTDVILMLNCYIVGVRSNAFRLTDKYLFCKSARKIVIDDFSLCKKISTGQKDNSKRLPHHHRILQKTITGKELKVDLWLANYQNESHRAKGYRDISHLSGKEYEKQQEKIENRYLFMSRMIENLESGHYFYKRNEDHLRHYTPVTSSPKILRPAFTFRDKEMVEVDLKNSQFLMSTLLLRKETWRNASSDKFLRKIWKGIECKRLGVNKKTYNEIMVLIEKTIEPQGASLPYIQMTLNGKLYEDLIDDLIDAGHIDENLSFDEQRSVAKTKMIEALFAKTDTAYHQRYNSVWMVMKRRHPEVIAVFEFIKEYNHVDMSKILQRIESLFIIDTVCKKLCEEYPKIPVFSLHDCVVSTVGNENIIDNIIKQEMVRLFGFQGKTKIQFWDSIVPPICDFSLIEAA